jgi:hypothetical protein
MTGQIKVPLKPGSDADATHRPVGTTYVLVDPPTLYLEKLAQQWMQARGETRPGVSYILVRTVSEATGFEALTCGQMALWTSRPQAF